MIVTAINEYGDGRYIIHFEKTYPCKCGVERITRIWNFDKKPTEAEALKKLAKEK